MRIWPASWEAPPASRPKMTKSANSQTPTMVKPMAAMPKSLPIINSPGVTEDKRTSMMRLDFSSMVLFRSIWMMTKMATHRR